MMFADTYVDIFSAMGSSFMIGDEKSKAAA